MKKIIFVLLILLTVSAGAQDRSKFLYAEFADKSVTLYPFYKPFGSNFDPAVTLGGGLNYIEKGNSTLFQTIQITAYSTTNVGNGLTLTSSFGYRYRLTSGFFGEAMVGLGASGYYNSRETFTQNDDGEYSAAIPINIVAALPLDLLLGYSGDSFALYVKYRYMGVVPYNEVYPVMPVSLFGIGVRFNLDVSK